MVIGKSASTIERAETLTSSTTLLPAVRSASTRSTARLTIQASMSRAKPKRSAAGRKAAGGTSSSSSPAIRISSSYRAPGSSARCTIGWQWTTNRSRSSAVLIRSVQASPVWCGAFGEAPGAVQRARCRDPRPWPRTWRHPPSTSSCSAVSSARSRSVSPMLAVIRRARSPTVDVWPRMRSTRLVATERASAASTPLSRMPNSSPPKRATTSADLSLLLISPATLLISSSPAWCPKASLTYLKLSRSTISSAPPPP